MWYNCTLKIGEWADYYVKFLSCIIVYDYNMSYKTHYHSSPHACALNFSIIYCFYVPIIYIFFTNYDANKSNIISPTKHSIDCMHFLFHLHFRRSSQWLKVLKCFNSVADIISAADCRLLHRHNSELGAFSATTG